MQDIARTERPPAMTEPPEAVQLLPVEAYTGQDWFDREMRTLFTQTWAFAGMVEDVAKPGDYVCIKAGRAPLFVIRGHDDQLRAFHNLCRHRGARLLEGRGTVEKSIVCFYHAWRYGLDGDLLSVPQEKSQFDNFDRSCLGLLPARVEIWKGLMFVHADPDAAPLADWMGGIPAGHGPHDPEALVEVSQITYRVKANWKIVIENFIDGYHFFYLHHASLGDGDFSRQQWHPDGRHWVFSRPLKPGRTNELSIMPLIDGLGHDFGVTTFVLFPNLAVFERANHWLTFHAEPVAPDETHVTLRIRALPQALERMEAVDGSLSGLPEFFLSVSGYRVPGRNTASDIHPLESDDVTLEDVYACEAVQEGMLSPRFVVGPMSKFESAITFFQANVRDYVETGH